MPDGDSFLPRIQSVFYAVFDVRQGPKIVYQVPEGLIAVPAPSVQNGTSSVPPTPSPEAPSPGPQSSNHGLTSRNSSTSLISPTDFYRPDRRLPSPQQRSSSSQRTLFNFNDISMYVIPPSPLCGRLVTCSTPRQRIIGFPVELKGKYKRNYFRYNLCFVFDRGADLSCYEPVVRKVSRVLKSCEEESCFLSSPDTSPAVHAILEQLYEDLNSYSETSIPIDQFNSIELKIFPFYPNPPSVKDWVVPLALINLSKRIEDNWDLTMAKVCKYIDGINHVSRIAQLADCDISLTRQAISHLLYYQVIMTIDIFQYSNMYTLRKNIQWLADEAHVKDECGPYITKPGMVVPDWPKLLHLYSRLKSGKTVFEWMQEFEVEQLGIDVRRFTTFGVIKGFLRRVHRWPVYLPPEPSQAVINSELIKSFDGNASRFAGKGDVGMSGTSHQFPAFGGPLIDKGLSQVGRPLHSTLFPDQPIPDLAADSPLISTVSVAISATHRARRASAAEKVLEQLRSRDVLKSGALPSPRTSWIHFQHKDDPLHSAATFKTGSQTTMDSTTLPLTQPTQESPTKAAIGRSESRRHSLISPAVPPPSPVLPKIALIPSRPRPARTPSAPHVLQVPTVQETQPPYPRTLIAALDGEHHTDELGVMFGASWFLLEQWLIAAGEGEGNGDYGRVVMLYR